MFNGFYTGKRVLVTGHTGFKGAWLSLWLRQLGAEVCGLALPASTRPNLHEIIRDATFADSVECDIRDGTALAGAIKRTKPEVVFHLAAQSLVRRSYAEPLETLNTNAVGTAHLLQAVRLAELPCIVIVVTSDKCYENREWDYAYRETDPLGGHDVYSMSKAAAELIAQSWNKSFFLPNPKLGPVATVRAGNVIGGGDYAEDRIVPDIVRALVGGNPIPVRNPAAVRPWQHVLECLSGYLWLGARLGKEGKASSLASPFNFGPDPAARQPVRRLVEEFLNHWPGEWRDVSNANNPHEARLLTLSIDKASAILGWRPVWSFAEAVRETAVWYRHRHAEKDADLRQFSIGQIEAYVNSARSQELSWTKA